MGLSLLDIINSRIAANLGLTVLQTMPKAMGAYLATFAADRIVARRNQPVVQAVRLNQWVAHNKSLTKAELDGIVRQTFRNRARALFDLFHYMNNEIALDRMIDFGADFEEISERNKNRIEGTVIIVIHSGAHELVAIAAALRGMEGLGLSVTDQSGGYQWHDEMRAKSGFEALPTNMASMKKAIRYLKDGGTVITGMDRPYPGSGYRPRFFGQPTSLPVHYVSLAIKANVPIVIAFVRRTNEGNYFIDRSDFIEMERFKDRREEIYTNAERLLSQAEVLIRKTPDQWAMFFPIWPELLADVP
jgi:KDO2-lipid IV(A) lauroyltransferase